MEQDNSVIHLWFKAFLLALVVVSITGVIMVYSSSYIYATEVYQNSSYFFVRQLIFLSIGAALAFVVSRTRYDFWLKYSTGINLFISIALVLTFIPGIGVSVKGANRWINVAGFSLQPGEILKYTVLLSGITYFEQFTKVDLKKRIQDGVLLFLPMVLVILQPDYGTFMICFLGLLFTCYMSSFPRKIFYSIIPVAVVIGSALLVAQPYRVERLKTFWDPWQSPQGSGFQIIQSWMGFANGSLFGQGLGNSHEKLFYLPEAHNDFIFSVLGEELGFVGVVFVVTMFLVLILSGFKIVLLVKQRAAALLAACAIFTLGFQALLNMMVVLGLLPTKGLNLPFISYGGSSLISNFFAIGLFLSVYFHQKRDEAQISEGYQSPQGSYRSMSRESTARQGQDLFSQL